MVSCGGISKSLRDEALVAIYTFDKFVKSLPEGGDDDDDVSGDIGVWRSILLKSLLLVVEVNNRVERVLSPALNMLDIILKSDVIDVYYRVNYELLQAFIDENVQVEVLKCTNIQRIISYVGILFQCMGMGGPVRFSSFKILVRLLGHKFPKIRTSE